MTKPVNQWVLDSVAGAIQVGDEFEIISAGKKLPTHTGAISNDKNIRMMLWPQGTRLKVMEIHDRSDEPKNKHPMFYLGGYNEFFQNKRQWLYLPLIARHFAFLRRVGDDELPPPPEAIVGDAVKSLVSDFDLDDETALADFDLNRLDLPNIVRVRAKLREKEISDALVEA